ncbi:MAG: RpiB/LacA/LacB family sugar-phosphate isomerase [Bacteroidetes bacterium]|nr:RpiB/LacA/LacB family sugar-phosphate isomerase [Bacteroidota bacterium]
MTTGQDKQHEKGTQMNIRGIAIGADHGSYEAKEMLKRYLESAGYKIIDVGTNNSTVKVDYPDFALAVARKVVSGECERGIMLDAAGIGSSMVCNKVHGIRAALCWSQKTIINSREHNNANVLTMGTSQHPKEELCVMAKLWLETKFEGGRHWPRINKMMSIEREGK